MGDEESALADMDSRMSENKDSDAIGYFSLCVVGANLPTTPKARDLLLNRMDLKTMR